MKRDPRFLVWGILFVLLGGAGVSVSSIRRAKLDDPAALQLVLNIPANRLDVYEAGARTRSYEVSVGKRPYNTPPGKYRISSVVWNPWWHPPDSKWAEGRKPAPPGPTNPMGRVKLNFAPLLYIHGTTEEDRLGAPASHGCVRMANGELIELARLVHARTETRVSSTVLDELVASPKMTRQFQLRRSVPLTVVYDLVEVRDRHLVIHPDVYRKGDQPTLQREVMEVLKKEGINVNALNRELLSRITMKRNATRLEVPLETLANGDGR